MSVFKIVKEYIYSRSKARKAIGVILILIGVIAFLTPLTPGSWLVIIGLELLGWRILLFDKVNPFFLYVQRSVKKLKFWEKE